MYLFLKKYIYINKLRKAAFLRKIFKYFINSSQNKLLNNSQIHLIYCSERSLGLI